MSRHSLVLGESLVDAVRTRGTVTEHVGGSPMNVAVGLARLGHRTVLGSWWGRDARGARIEQTVAAAGAGILPGSDGASFTTVAHAHIDADKNASYTFDLDPGIAPLTDLRGATHIHTGSLGAVLDPGGEAIAAAVAASRDTATISYDPNARPSLMGTAEQVRVRMEALISLADVVKASDDDVAWLYPAVPVEQVMAAWAARGPALVVITLGAAGSLSLVPGATEPAHVPPLASAVNDTVGAGDSFMAGLLGGLLDAGLLGSVEARERLRTASWADVASAVRRATSTAAITVSHDGAYAPTPDEVTALMALGGSTES
ncbi:MAG: PfkB family carbohydrate kinase [Propioniciclava sp.]